MDGKNLSFDWRKFQWLTQYNPKSKAAKVGTPRMVKLTDDRFAVLYTVTKNEKSKLYYVVVSDAGKKIYTIPAVY